jgi:hypothetical protein
MRSVGEWIPRRSVDRRALSSIARASSNGSIIAWLSLPRARGEPWSASSRLGPMPSARSRSVVGQRRDAGIRLTILDALYLHGGLGPDRYSPLNDVQVRFSDGSAEAWAERVAPFNPKEAVVGSTARTDCTAAPAAATRASTWR